MITADLIRQIITDHDNARPRSQQTAIGPSNLSTPCSRKLAYQLLGVPQVTGDAVNLKAWAGTAVHAQMEAALADDPDWEVEVTVGLDLGDGLTLTGHLDAYHRPSKTLVDWKTTGPSAHAKYTRQSPESYLTQTAVYGLLAVMSGRMAVERTGIVYIPRNGDLSDIHADIRPWDQDRADAALKLLTALHTAAAAGPAVLPLIPTADDCRFCGWWMPGSDNPEVACTGHPIQEQHGIPAWEEPQ